jgi:hypothetical protein
MLQAPTEIGAADNDIGSRSGSHAGPALDPISVSRTEPKERLVEKREIYGVDTGGRR